MVTTILLENTKLAVFLILVLMFLSVYIEIVAFNKEALLSFQICLYSVRYGSKIKSAIYIYLYIKKIITEFKAVPKVSDFSGNAKSFIECVCFDSGHYLKKSKIIYDFN